ncbi:MAG: alpha/beta hydrolase [Desulfitobacteriaceae bacterium]|nr:alpha/beta hydrolase [Desulfitobacteriaceae bacterium]MDD4346425.1 alpha/beta hydrolase [Desulfitobacteriaceae bacterium]MDD4400833.1 alpha/beta hydrolase [Desulfitobacteriaceae bacterium]
MRFRDFKININGKELHMREWPGSGNTIICLHGFACNCHWWDKFAERLSPSFRIITYDLPGCGDSAAPAAEFGMEEHAKDILEIIDKLNLGKVNLMGHSLGAVTAVYFASEFGDKLKHLVLIDGGYPMAGAVEVINLLISGLDRTFPSFKKYLEFMQSMPFFSEISPYLERAFYYGVIHRSDGSVISKVNKDFVLRELEIRAQRKHLTKELLPRIKTPALMLWASQGSGIPGVYVVTREKGEEIVSKIHGSRFAAIANSNHFTIMNREQSIREIEAFIKYF